MFTSNNSSRCISYPLQIGSFRKTSLAPKKNLLNKFFMPKMNTKDKGINYVAAEKMKQTWVIFWEATCYPDCDCKTYLIVDKSQAS